MSLNNLHDVRETNGVEKEVDFDSSRGKKIW